MAVKIRLKRMGKIRQPYYRIVVADSRTKRDGRVIEEIGKYHPKQNPSLIEVDSERAQYWLGVGAQPSEPVTAILKVTGDWQRFNGEAAPEPMQVAEPKRDKTEIFNEALRDSAGETRTEAVTPRRTPRATADAGADASASATDVHNANAASAAAPEAAPAEELPVEQGSPVTDAAVADEAVTEDTPVPDEAVTEDAPAADEAVTEDAPAADDDRA